MAASLRLLDLLLLPLAVALLSLYVVELGFGVLLQGVADRRPPCKLRFEGRLGLLALFFLLLGLDQVLIDRLACVLL